MVNSGCGGDSLHLGCVCERKGLVFWEGMSFTTVIRVDEGWFDHVGSGYPNPRAGLEHRILSLLDTLDKGGGRGQPMAR